MLATIFTGTTRYRRQILATAVVVAAGVLLVRSLSTPQSTVAFELTDALYFLGSVSAVLALLALLWPRPAALTVDPRRLAFRAFPAAWFVYFVVGPTFMSMMGIGSEFLRPSTETEQGPHGTLLLLVGISAVLLVLAWRDTGLELRPDGLTYHTPVGALTVPWEALAPGYPQPGPGSSLVLAYAQPELVRRRCLASRRQLAAQTLNVNPRFLGAAIAHYVAYPQYRAAIGTQAEYERLRHALNDPAGPLPATSR